MTATPDTTATATTSDCSDLPVETWSIDDLAEMSPTDYLVGCLTKQWQGDQDSMTEATITLLTATFVQADLDPEEAYEKAWDYAERGIKLTWDGSALGFEFDADSTSRAEPS